MRPCCRVLEVAPSSCYDWLVAPGAGATNRELNEAHLVNAIIDIHDALDDSYESPRLTDELPCPRQWDQRWRHCDVVAPTRTLRARARGRA